MSAKTDLLFWGQGKNSPSHYQHASNPTFNPQITLSFDPHLSNFETFSNSTVVKALVPCGVAWVESVGSG
jgi:hypothetical protein